MLPVERTKVRRRPVQSSVGPSTSSSLFNRRDSTGHVTLLSLHGKDFVLDIENGRVLLQLTTEIEKLGGRIVNEVNEEKKPWCLVSDSPHMAKIEQLKPEKITPPLLRILPMLVRDAIRLRVRYRSTESFTRSLENLKKNIKTQKKAMTTPTKAKAESNAVASTPKSGPINLQQPYLKLEDNRGAFTPLYKQFTPQANCQKIYLGKHMGRSLFHKNHHPDAPRTEKSPIEKTRLALQPKGGFCEICCKKFENSKEHFASREHTLNVNQPGLWSSVDKLTGSWLDYVSSSNPPRTRRHRPSPPSPSDYRHSL
ncbi:hypothetical protein PRIPAC_92152 [Pristionchus pacificus]|uniref:DBF4-type domain-containing protein n=1 Tax=Pristionchus pacificus TaxID=54126 RepID=A0A2A6BA92_PRIPA|nr:hypothetical protein PRIPAC_92152 [Pristionchus pacificus]|eukprot:PDM62805.1 hypothetical protein PRIPAC_50020 [Pristionchus pacificus]